MFPCSEYAMLKKYLDVIPAQAGIQSVHHVKRQASRVLHKIDYPVCARMT